MSAPASQVYQFRILVRGVSPIIWRRVLLPADETLAELHRVIQIAFDYSDTYLHQFRIHGRDYGIHRLGGPSYPRSAYHVELHELELRDGERFIYTYNFFDNWEHELRLEQRLPVDPKRTYPVCTGGKRKGPLEDCGGPLAYQHLIWLSKRGPFRDYLQLCLNLGELFDPNLFDRREVNRRLKSGQGPEVVLWIESPDDPFRQQLSQLLSLLDYGTLEVPWDDDF